MYKIINVLLQKLFGVKIQRVDKNISKNKIYDKDIYVEFVGTPGVGKTTICKKVQEITNVWNGNNVLNKCNSTDIQDSLFYKMLAKYKLINVNSQDVTDIDKMFLLGYFYKILVDDFIINKCNNGIVVTDEGLVHNFGNEIFNKSLPSLERVLQLLEEKPDILEINKHCKQKAIEEIVFQRIDKFYLENKESILQLKRSIYNN